MVDEATPPSVRAAPDVRFRLPDPGLRDLVTAYVVVEIQGPLTDHLHPEWVNMRFILSGTCEIEDPAGGGALVPGMSASLFGPTDRARLFVSSASALLGVGLTPVGWMRLIGGDASAIANRVVPLGDALGVPGEALADSLRTCEDDAGRFALLDRLLLRRARVVRRREGIAVLVHNALVSGSACEVRDFAEIVGISQSALHRLCLRVFGFSPKRLLRRQRFLRTLSAVRDAPDRPLTELMDPAYYDQAHFNRDFKQYMGTTPLAYFSSPRELMRRAAEERRRVIGAPVQGLHPAGKR
ncbi:MAG: helix-turn-helix domain-containing protein [Sphingomonas sp.]